MTDANQSTKGKEAAAVDDSDEPDSHGADPTRHRSHGHQSTHRSIAGGTKGAEPFFNSYAGGYVNCGSAGSSWIAGGNASSQHMRNERHSTSPSIRSLTCYKEQLNILVETSLGSLTIRDHGGLLVHGRRNVSGWVNHHGRQQVIPDANCGQAHQAVSSPAGDPYAGRRLGDVRGTMSSVARSFQGCRFLVRMVAEGGAAAAEQVLEEVAGEIVRLMVDSVAHKLVEKLVEHWDDDQITRVLHILAASPGQIVTVARNHAGSNILQTLVDRIAGNARHVEVFTSALAHTGEHAVALLTQHGDGSRLIIRCLDMFSVYQNRFIIVVVTSSFFFHRVSRDRHGCNVLNSYIDKAVADKQPWNTNSVVHAVCMDALALAEHGYGNYVVQHVIRSMPQARDWLHTTFRGQYVSLSRQAASSHVVQWCLELFSSEQVDEIIRELLGCHHWDCRFPQLISDPYANYVLQTAMGRREVRMHNALLDAISMHRNLLQGDRIAREVFRTLRKVLPPSAFDT